MIADIVAFWLAGSRDSPDRASDRRDWSYRGGPAADEEIRARFGTLVSRACARACRCRPPDAHHGEVPAPNVRLW